MKDKALGRLQSMLSDAKLIRIETETLDGRERGEAGLSEETLATGSGEAEVLEIREQAQRRIRLG